MRNKFMPERNKNKLYRTFLLCSPRTATSHSLHEKRYCSFWMPECQQRQPLQRENISLVGTQTHWLLPDLPFEIKVPSEQNQKAQSKQESSKLPEVLSPSVSVSLRALCLSLPPVWGHPRVAGALHSSSGLGQHSPPSSKCCWKENTAPGQMFPHRPQQTHNYFNRALRYS